MPEQNAPQSHNADGAAAILAGALGGEATAGNGASADPRSTEKQTEKAGADSTAPPNVKDEPADQKPAGKSDDLAKIITANIEQATRPLLDRIAQMESGEKGREAERRGEDRREAFIRSEMRNFPPEFARKFLPATEDQAKLHAGCKEAERIYKTMMESAVASGRMRWVNMGGLNREGGDATGGLGLIEYSESLGKKGSPQQMLAAELNRGG